MPDRARELDWSVLTERRVSRTGLVLELDEDLRGEVRLAALDADRREFVWLPAGPAGMKCRSLSHDGTRMLLVDSPTPDNSGRKHRNPSGSICVLTLGTGEERWYPALATVADIDVAESPDGGVIAILGTETDESDESVSVVLDILEPLSGERRRIWQAEGWVSFAPSLCWSPAGDLLAVSYFIWDEESENDEVVTTIVNPRDGGIIVSRKFTVILKASSASWLNDRVLACIDEYDVLPVYYLSADTGDVRSGPRQHHHVRGIVDGRELHQVPNDLRSDKTGVELYTCLPSQADRRPFLMIRPYITVTHIHTATAYLRQP